MAMEILRVLENAHDNNIACIAYNRVKHEILSVADGDKQIKVWDLKTGTLIRTQTVHKGAVTSIVYASSVKLLFSASIDGTIGVWTDKGSLLQVVPLGGPVFSLAWGSKQRMLVAGGNSILHVFNVDTADALKLKQARRQAEHSSAPRTGAGPAVNATQQAASDAPKILKRACVPFRGRNIISQAKADELNERRPGGGSFASESVALGSSSAATDKDKVKDYCHTDVIKAIVVTSAGKIFSGGFDRCLCMYETDKLEKPEDAFKKIANCHKAGIVSLGYDAYNNCILSGGVDGSVKTWSIEGRCLDTFENVSNRPVSVAYVPSTNCYWATGRFNKIWACDPRAPANITSFVSDPNSLFKYSVELLYSPPATDLMLAATKNRQLVVWQYNPHGARRVFQAHEDLVEGLLVLHKGDDVAIDHQILSWDASGRMLRWVLDVEQNCEVYNCVEEWELHSSNIHCCVHSLDMNALITGGEDSAIRVHYLSGEVPLYNDAPLPTSFNEHTSRVVGLVLLPNKLLLSVSHDRSLRVWDLTTMKCLHVEAEAHDTPIQCLEHCPERQEIATCAMGNKVKIWSIAEPLRPRLVRVLDHGEASSSNRASPSANGAADVDNGKKTNMTWLTRSDMDGLPEAATTNDLVAEALRNVHQDVPEVTQVRWVPFRGCWVTAADDEIIRLWSPEGAVLHAFSFEGSSVQCMYVDTTHEVLVAAMLDRNAYLYDLDDPIPKAKYSGHSDVIRSIELLPSLDCYVSASWDKTVRLWPRPHTAGLLGRRPSMKAQDLQLMPEDSHGRLGGKPYISEYEKAHPLEVPQACLQDHTIKMLQAIGIMEPPPGQKTKRRFQPPRTPDGYKSDDDEPPPGSLASKLAELNSKLLSELNPTPARGSKASHTSRPSDGRGRAQRLSEGPGEHSALLTQPSGVSIATRRSQGGRSNARG